MSRTFDARFQALMFRSASEEVLATLIQISHSKLPASLYYVNKAADVVSTAIDPVTLLPVTGVTFKARGFDIPFPSELTETLPSITFTLDNTDRSPGYALLQTANGIKPSVFLSLILLTEPTVLQFGPALFKANPCAGDLNKLSFNLSFEDALNEQFPANTITPYGYPAAFGQQYST